MLVSGTTGQSVNRFLLFTGGVQGIVLSSSCVCVCVFLCGKMCVGVFLSMCFLLRPNLGVAWYRFYYDEQRKFRFLANWATLITDDHWNT